MPDFPTISAQGFLRRADELIACEDKLQELFQAEIGNKFKIGALLLRIKSKKIYRFKDTDQDYTWRQWADEFIGSKRTADRYVDLYEIFINHYNYTAAYLKDIHPSYFYEIIPLLKSGTEKPKEEVDDLLQRAKNATSIKEFKQGLTQKDYSIEEINEEGKHEHIWKEHHFKKCTICEKITALPTS